MKELCLVWYSYGISEVYYLGTKEQNDEIFITKLINKIISILKYYDIDDRLLDKLNNNTPLKQLYILKDIIEKKYKTDVDSFEIFEIVNLQNKENNNL